MPYLQISVNQMNLNSCNIDTIKRHFDIQIRHAIYRFVVYYKNNKMSVYMAEYQVSFSFQRL